MPLPKLEGEIVISATTTVGTFVGASVSVSAGRYFLTSGFTGSSFLAHLKSQLDSATSRTWTLTLDDDTDTATGKLTMAVSGAATTATWSSTTIRDLLGFDTNLSSGTSWTGADQCQYLWLPNCGRSSVLGPAGSGGAIESDGSSVMAPSGAMYQTAYTARYYDNLEFRTVKGSKMRATLESTTNESFESFWLKTLAYGRSIRHYNSRDTDGTYDHWRAEQPFRFEPVPVIEQWTESADSLWSIGYRVRKNV